MEMHAEKVAFHRFFQPVTEFRLNGQKTQTVIACYGVRTVNDRQIDRVAVAEAVLHAEVGNRGSQIGNVGLDRPAVRGTYGIGQHSCQSLGDRLRRLRFRLDRCLRVRRIGFGRGFRSLRFRPTFGFFVPGRRIGRHDVSLGQDVGSRIRFRIRKHIGYGDHIGHSAPPLRGIRRPEMIFFQSLVNDKIGFDLVASILCGRQVLLERVVRGAETQYAHFHVARFDRQSVLSDGSGKRLDSGCVSLVISPEHTSLRGESENNRILLPLRERACLLPKTLAGAGGYVAARLLCRNGQAIQQEAEQKDRAERSRTTSADRNTFVKTSHSLLCITVKNRLNFILRLFNR